MRKFLHMAGGIAKKTLATAAKLAKKLAHIVLQAAGAAVSAVGKAVKDLLGRAACGVGKKVQKFIPPVCKVQGYAKAAKEFDIRAVCAVGMGPASQAGAEKVRAKMGIPAEVPVFTLQGGFDINKLHGPYKWIMQLKCKEIRKTLAGKASLSPAQQLTYDMATKGASAVSAENLTPIIDWYKTKEG